MTRSEKVIALLAELEAKKAARRAAFALRHHCSECNADLGHFDPEDDFMLTHEVWAKVHPEGGRGFLCHHCLPKRAERYLGKTLTPDDFLWCLCPVNCKVHAITREQAIEYLLRNSPERRRTREHAEGFLNSRPHTRALPTTEESPCTALPTAPTS